MLDPTPYLSVPYLSAFDHVTLVDALEAAAPPSLIATVEAALDRMLAEREELEARLDRRKRATGSQQLASELELDHCVDGAWFFLRDGLRAQLYYGRAGFATLAASAAPQDGVDYGARVAAAARAEELLARLFGPGGLNFLRLRYTEQVSAMAMILRVIEEEELGADIDALVGKGSVALLRDLHGRYAAMVEERMRREGDATERLKPQIDALRGALQLYTLAVLGMLDASEEGSVAIVRESLQPLLNFRAQSLAARSVRSGSPRKVEAAGLDAASESAGASEAEPIEAAS